MNLVKLSENDYVWTSSAYGIKHLPSLSDTVKYGYNHLGIAVSEIEIGLLELINKEHNVIEFGDMRRTFMFTRQINVDPSILKELKANKGDK